MVRVRVWAPAAALLLGCGSDDGAPGDRDTGAQEGTAAIDDGPDPSPSSTDDGLTTAQSGPTSDPGTQTGNDGGPTGVDPEACAAMDDEFDDPGTLECWTDYDASLYTRLDIGATAPGRLTLEPVNTDGWFGGGDGPFLYKMVSGDFVVETHVSAVDRESPSDPPSQGFNSAGLVIRDPASAPGSENWLMYNLGFQDGVVGTEGKTTTDSESILTVNEGSNRGRLRVCRLGETFTMLKWLDDEDQWTTEHTFPRPDLPAAMQVGIVGNGFTAPPDLRAEFDYVRFGTVAEPADCTAAF